MSNQSLEEVLGALKDIESNLNYIKDHWKPPHMEARMEPLFTDLEFAISEVEYLLNEEECRRFQGNLGRDDL